MAEYRSKWTGLVVEAELFDRDKKHRLSPEFRAAICNCLQGLDYEPEATDAELRALQIQNGWHVHASYGPLPVRDCDWIIRGPKGEFYPLAAEVFATTYEPAGRARSEETESNG